MVRHRWTTASPSMAQNPRAEESSRRNDAPMNLCNIVTVFAQTAAQHGWSATLRLAFLMVISQLLRVPFLLTAILWWSPYR